MGEGVREKVIQDRQCSESFRNSCKEESREEETRKKESKEEVGKAPPRILGRFTTLQGDTHEVTPSILLNVKLRTTSRQFGGKDSRRVQTAN